MEHATVVDLDHPAASPELETWVEHYWTVRWDLGNAAYRSEVVPHPAVHLSVESGTTRHRGIPMPAALVHGVATSRFMVDLSGEGRVFGVKFRPGGFGAFTGEDVGAWTGRVLDLRAAFGGAADSLRDAVLAEETDEARAGVMDAFLVARTPAANAAYERVLDIVSGMLADPGLTSVETVCERFDVSVRTLQRLFRRYVGVGPKWVLRRYRLHDAMALIDAGEGGELAALAVRLGWYDQAHFTRDFAAVVGQSPAAYAASTASATSAVSGVAGGSVGGLGVALRGGRCTPWLMAVSTTFGRRAFLRSASAAATLTAAAAAAPLTGARAAQATTQGSGLPRTVQLPQGLRPEGITSGPGDRYYVGSLADGRIVTGDLSKGTSRVLLPGATGRAIRGLWFDHRSGLVWAAGNVDTEAHVWAVRAWSGRVAHDAVVPDAVFLNDLVVTERAVWVTDSRKDRLTRIALDEDGHPRGSEPEFVDLGGDWPAFDGTNINANGIRQLPDGSLVLNNSNAGGLWQVQTRTGEATEIPVSGGPGIVGGDGLALHDRVLYNVRGSGPDQVAVLRLLRDGGDWRARWITALTHDELDVPTTATLAADWLWTVNARFNTVPDPLTAEYWITRLPIRG